MNAFKILCISMVFPISTLAFDSPSLDLSVQQINVSPISFENKKVLLTGEVDELLGSQSFRLDGDKSWYFDEVVIVTSTPMNTLIPEGLLKEGDHVSVIGRVRNAAVIDVESKYGFDFDPEVEIELEDVVHYIEATELNKIN